MTMFQNVDDALDVIQKAHAWLSDHQPKVPYESPLLKPWTTATAGMSSTRLRTYATTVIPQRMLHLIGFTSTKARLFAGGYLLGIEHKNPYLLYTNARCQVELLAALYAPINTIREVRSIGINTNSVTKLDRALVTFLFGNRSDMFDLFAKMAENSEVMPPTAREDLTAKNILTLLEKLNHEHEARGLLDRYKRLCEYLHPNFLSNFVLTESFIRNGHTWIRMHDADDFVLSRAVRDTADTMGWATDLVVRLTNTLEPPFGTGSMVFPAARG